MIAIQPRAVNRLLGLGIVGVSSHRLAHGNTPISGNFLGLPIFPYSVRAWISGTTPNGDIASKVGRNAIPLPRPDSPQVIGLYIAGSWSGHHKTGIGGIRRLTTAPVFPSG